jgi:transposase
MANAKTWRKRIDEYCASGLSAAKFAEGRDFSAHQVWNWAAKFRMEDQACLAETKVTSASAAPAPVLVKSSGVRIARLVRVPSQPPPTERPVAAELSVEMLGVRVFVPRGFDRATFSLLLDEIDAHGARARRP